MGILCGVFACLWIPSPASGDRFVINTIGGPVEIEIGHVGPKGSLVPVSAPKSAGFRPPTIFSAPLPSGSGARALGFAGAFTAIADDATAASWNPAGLVQLENPEASVVLRGSYEIDNHHSDAAGYKVGGNEFDSENLNYFSFDYPFQTLNRNFVFSANYQEAYDFTQHYTSEMSHSSVSSSEEKSAGTYSQTATDHYVQGIVEIDVTSHLTTQVNSTLRQLLSSGAVTDIDFAQEGTIDALTYALASEVTPELSVGAAVNFYRDGVFGGGRIRSRTVAKYSGEAASSVSANDERITTGTYSYTGVAHFPPSGGMPAMDVPISGAGSYPPMSGTERSHSKPTTLSEGVYEEVNEYDGLNGMNGTFGILWTVSRRLSLGFDVDLPWSARGEQTKTTKNTLTTYDATHSRVLNVSESYEVESKTMAFDFPLYWAVGTVWRWDNYLYSSLDVSQTRWSDFAFRTGGQGKMNPLDGSPHGQNRIDDCWSVRCGTEYLWVLANTEVPLRWGISWEERPATGSPDQYWGLSLGSGISIGKGAGKTIIDIAYMFTWGNDVLHDLVPNQEGLSTDVYKHQVYVSTILHF